MTISSLIVLLQSVVLLLSATINNPLATDEMRTQALSLSSQAFEISASYLEINQGSSQSIVPGQSIGTPANVNPIISVPVSETATTTSTVITPQDCKVPTDNQDRKVLNADERVEADKFECGHLIDNEANYNYCLTSFHRDIFLWGLSGFQWYRNAVGWCEK